MLVEVFGSLEGALADRKGLSALNKGELLGDRLIRDILKEKKEQKKKVAYLKKREWLNKADFYI